MFAVSRKPISINPGKFVIKTDSKDAKPKVEGEAPKTTQEITCRKIFENSNSFINSPPSDEKTALSTTPSPGGSEIKEMKRIKYRLSIIKDVPYSQKTNLSGVADNAERKSLKKTKEMKMKQKRINREGNFNCGRWQPEEHERFIEAIMKYGNEWKSVQKHVGTRSSTQARSHAQKFFVKIKKTNLLDLNMDFSKNSIKTLHEIANTMNAEEYFHAIKTLNCVAFERKNNPKRRHKKEDDLDLDSDSDSSDIFADTPDVLNLNNDDIFSLNTNDNTLFNCNKHSEIAFNINSFKPFKEPSLGTNNSNNSFINSGNYHIKIIQSDSKGEQPQNKKSHNKHKGDKNGNINTIIINNNINTYNYNVNINNYSNCNETNENNLKKKRNRMNSFEGLFNLFPELTRECGINSAFYNQNRKKVFDESEYIDNFNCTFKTVKNDFDVEKELEDLIMLSHSEEISNSINQFNNGDLIIFENSLKNTLNDHNFDFGDLMMDLTNDKKVKKNSERDRKHRPDDISIEPCFFI